MKNAKYFLYALGAIVLYKISKTKVSVTTASVPKPTTGTLTVGEVVQTDKDGNDLLKKSMGYDSGVIYNADGSKSIVGGDGQTYPVITGLDRLPTPGQISTEPVPLRPVYYEQPYNEPQFTQTYFD